MRKDIIALNYNKFFKRSKLKVLPTYIRLKGWFLLKILEQRKVRKIYGNITLNRLRKLYNNLLKSKGNFFFNFLKTLEYRFDVLVFKLNLFTTIKYCQYLIKSRNITVSNKFRNYNYIVKLGENIKIIHYKQLKSNYILNFKYKDKYFNNVKNVTGIYLYRFLLNLNIFKNLNQIYFYLKKNLILVNNIIISFPRYKLAFKKSRITIKNFGLKKNLKFDLKKELKINKNLNLLKKNNTVNIIFNFNKFYIYYTILFLKKIKKNFNLRTNLLSNFWFNSYKFKYICNIWKIKKNIILNLSTITNVIYKKPFFIIYNKFKNIERNKKIKNSKNFEYFFKMKKKNIILFKLKKNIYFLNLNNIFFNNKFNKLQLKKIKNYKFSLLKNHNYNLQLFYCKKYNLNKVQHLEINYKIKNAILLKYFNISSITSKDIVYLGIIIYYFFQYN
jgi:ribosomal protein S4